MSVNCPNTLSRSMHPSYVVSVTRPIWQMVCVSQTQMPYISSATDSQCNHFPQCTQNGIAETAYLSHFCQDGIARDRCNQKLALFRQSDFCLRLRELLMLGGSSFHRSSNTIPAKHNQKRTNAGHRHSMFYAPWLKCGILQQQKNPSEGNWDLTVQNDPLQKNSAIDSSFRICICCVDACH
jgi:hypothetical protein